MIYTILDHDLVRVDLEAFLHNRCEVHGRQPILLLILIHPHPYIRTIVILRLRRCYHSRKQAIGSKQRFPATTAEQVVGLEYKCDTVG